MKRIFLLPVLLILLFSCSPETEIRFTVSAGDNSYIDCPVAVQLSDNEMQNIDKLVMFEEKEKGREKIHFQVMETSAERMLWFIMEGKLTAGQSRSYVILPSDSDTESPEITKKIRASKDALTIFEGERSILEYRTTEKMPPVGVDTLFKRSAYIHPLWSPGGEVLTRIQPPDHYHHYGIWNPWTKTHIKGREIDYWNLARGQGTVRYAGLHFIEEGEVFCKAGVKQEHIDFGSGIPERVNMEEDMQLTYWGLNDDGTRYQMDKVMVIENVLTDTILFDAYLYGGGIGFRATEVWKADNCTVLTSEGKTRIDADGSRARWCIVEGESSTAQGRSGILFLSHPDNREHPEPMRVWPLEGNNGELFFEFCPIRHTEWKILPGTENRLNYRMVVFDGGVSPEEAEMYWNGFAKPPVPVFYL